MKEKEEQITKQELFLLKEYTSIDNQQFKILYDSLDIHYNNTCDS